MSSSPNKNKILEIVRRIPPGKVIYFGQIAELTGIHPRVAGWIMSGMTPQECEGLPWWRVVAKTGFVASLKLGYKGIAQKEMLEKEGYHLVGDHVDMGRHCLEDLEVVRV
jgi:methylated-DNA-protein-cysteine methyltransferase related protein